MSAVPRNDPPRIAVALRYDGQGAPRVIAKGRGECAERILSVARAYGIPLQDDPELVELLAQIDLGAEIPPKLYTLIAELFAFIHNLSGKPVVPLGK